MIGRVLLCSLLPLFCVALAACPASNVPENYDVTTFPPIDGGLDAELVPVASCVRMCANLSRLGCPEAATAGRTCNSVCAAGQASGFDMRVECVAAAASPAAVRGCCPLGSACSPVLCKGK